ncbi:hypothetical protein AAG570_009476 [Ranatra chinensis]|uniref:Uncharacterized protein n=1 Tax=Ranatra chinensis TaxID=642074 RepID=A0ABD0YP69_9HEMI
MDLDIDTGVDEGQQELTHRQWIRRVWDHRRTMDTKFSNLLAHHNWSIIRNNEIIRPTTIATLIQRPNFREDFKVYNKEFTSKPETDGSSFLTEDETTIRRIFNKKLSYHQKQKKCWRGLLLNTSGASSSIYHYSLNTLDRMYSHVEPS